MCLLDLLTCVLGRLGLFFHGIDLFLAGSNEMFAVFAYVRARKPPVSDCKSYSFFRPLNPTTTHHAHIQLGYNYLNFSSRRNNNGSCIALSADFSVPREGQISKKMGSRSFSMCIICLGCVSQATSTVLRGAASLDLSLDLVEAIQAKSCTCGGDKPCQHNSGSACYPMVLGPSGAPQCPTETSHCECSCEGGKPCHMEHGNLGCVATYTMYGTEVCPVGSKRCHVYHAATPAPTPPPAVTSGTCDVCDLAKPCKHDITNVCLPYYLSGGSLACPTGTTMCEQHFTAAQGHSSLEHARCVCGGGKPCQYLHGMGCFAKGLDENGALQCPDQTKECSCTCGTSNPNMPCQEQLLHSNFCFSLSDGGGNGPAVCPASTKHCQIFPAQTHISKLPPPSPLPTPAPTPSLHDPALGNCNSVIKWGPWQPCSLPCGGGTRKRSAQVTDPDTCTAPDQTEPCNDHICEPVDCKYAWPEEWGHCSYSCGTGYRYKRPIVTTAPRDGGEKCPVPLRQPCNTQSCWSKHTTCNCDPLRNGLVDPDAPPPSKRHVQCVRRDGVINVLHPPRDIFYTCAYTVSTGCACCTCDTIQCGVGEWGSWSSCDIETGLMWRTRAVEAEIFIHEQCPTMKEYTTCTVTAP